MSYTKIGVITRPQALKGEIRVNMFDEGAFRGLKAVQIDDALYTVTKVDIRPKFAVLKLEGIDSIDKAETLRSKEILADVKEYKLKKGEYIESDLIGKQVIGNHNTVYGTLTEINNYGSADIFTVKNGDQDLSFPFARNVILKVDSNIVVDEEIIRQIGVFQ